MKNIFMFWMMLLAQSNCMASEKEDETIQLSRTHNMEVIRETGDKVFYPKEYKSYQQFKEEYLEKEYIKDLLHNRLKILNNYLSLYDKNPKASEHLYYQNLLSRNQISITENATQDIFHEVSPITNYGYLELTNHAIQISSILAPC